MSNVEVDGVPNVTVVEVDGVPNVTVTVTPAPEVSVVVSPTGLPGPQGIQGVQGPPGENGANGLNGAAVEAYTFNQETPLSTWTIAHGLGRYPSVTLFDTAHTRIGLFDVQYPDVNTAQLNFTVALSGTAYLI